MALAAPDDVVVMDRETLLERCAVALSTIVHDYEPPDQRELTLPGRGGEMALIGDIRLYVKKGMLRSDDAVVCKHLAHVLCGGNRPTIHQASDQCVLDLEREAFLSLVGTPETQARIEQYLKTGTYLR